MAMEPVVMLRLGKVTATGKRQQTRVIAHLRLGQFPMKPTILRIFRMSSPWQKPAMQTPEAVNFSSFLPVQHLRISTECTQCSEVFIQGIQRWITSMQLKQVAMLVQIY